MFWLLLFYIVFCCYYYVVVVVVLMLLLLLLLGFDVIVLLYLCCFVDVAMLSGSETTCFIVFYVKRYSVKLLLALYCHVFVVVYWIASLVVVLLCFI